MENTSCFADDLENFEVIMDQSDDDTACPLDMSAVERALLEEPMAIPSPAIPEVQLSPQEIESPPPVVVDEPVVAPAVVEATDVGRTPAQLVCRVCGGRHALRRCRKFLSLSIEKRIRMVVRHRYCYRCLAQTHQSKGCPSRRRCPSCSGDHNVLLHAAAVAPRIEHGSSRSAQRIRSGSHTNRPSDLAVARSYSDFGGVGVLPLQNVVTLAPSLVVRVSPHGVSVPVRAVIDNCARQSQICRSMVENLGLPVTNIEGVQFCRLTVSSAYDPEQRLTFTARVHDLGRVLTPAEAVPERIKESFLGLPLADPQFYRVGRVAIVFGPEVYGRIITHRVYTSPGLPVAHYTIFGWVLSGLCNC
ncbi:uncharacterized protein LOC142241157 [Haematobia irritans]|uniref:uncharacterized protein LOC142241157 n=1 Tax=Haematobia irritans TaxID=7368 RepID=UPI003F50196D